MRELVDREPLVFALRPERVERVAITSGGGGGDLLRAAQEGTNLSSRASGEPSLHARRELGSTSCAAGHYATERLGVQALAERLAVRFGIEREFLEIANPV